MISKQDALAMVAEVQAEIAADIGEPVFELASHDEAPVISATERKLQMQVVEAREKASALRASVIAAERRAVEAERRAKVADRAARAATRGIKPVTSKLRSTKLGTGIVVVKIDGEKLTVKPGQTVEVSGATMDDVSVTPKSPLHSQRYGTILRRDKKF